MSGRSGTCSPWPCTYPCDTVSFALYQTHLFHNTSSIGLFLIDGLIGVFSVSKYIWLGIGVYVCACVCIRTHTKLHAGYSDVSWGVGTRHLEGSKNPDGPNFRIHLYVCEVHIVYIYWVAGSDLGLFFLWTYFALQKEKQKMQTSLWWYWELESTWILTT